MPTRAAAALPPVLRGTGVPAALARALAREGVRTLADLRRPAVFARLPRAAQAAVRHPPSRSVPLAEAKAVGAELARRLRLAGAAPLEVIPVGSVRREAPRAGDLDFLVVLAAPALGEPSLRLARPGDRLAIADTYAAGPRRRGLILARLGAAAGGPTRYYRTDLFATTPGEKPYALFHYTGPTAYNVRTRAHAKRRGWLLNQYGLFDAATGARVVAVRTERALAKALGVTYREPRDRGSASRN